MRFSPVKTFAASVCTIALLSVVGCGSDDTDAADTEPTTAAEAPAETPAETPAEEPAPDVAANLVGPGCAGYAEAVPDGAGSVSGMAEDPVATAASNNPLLKTLVAAVSGQLNPDVNLVDTLNGDEFTVFAPVDEAFAKLDSKTVTALSDPKNADMLSSILTYHVIPGQILPDDLAGSTQTSVQGGDVKITGDADNLKVNDATVICGGVMTANATVYLIDSVLSPPAA